MRLNDWHVLGGFDSWTSHVSTSTRADVWHSFFYSLPDRTEQLSVVERLQQSKCIAATDKD
jgi:hypothetical protein